MTYFQTFILALGLLFLSGCSQVSKTELSQEAEEVRILNRVSDNCRVHGQFTGVNSSGSLELAKTHAINQAARKGANAIIFEQQIKNGAEWRVLATGYRCE